MTREELLQLHKDTCDKARALMEKKNKDYTGKSGDIFANFTAAEHIAGVEVERNLLAKLLDKQMRMRSFLDNGTLAVLDDPVDNCIEDSINFWILIKAKIEERKAKNSSKLLEEQDLPF